MSYFKDIYDFMRAKTEYFSLKNTFTLSAFFLISGGLLLVYKLCTDLFHSFDNGSGGGIKSVARS